MGTLLECLCPVREPEVWQKEGGSWELRVALCACAQTSGHAGGETQKSRPPTGWARSFTFPKPSGLPYVYTSTHYDEVEENRF